MPVSNILSRVGTSIRLFRKPRRRKALRNSAPVLISSENRLEDRILLSATPVDDTPAADPVDYDALIDAIADDVEAEHIAPFQESIDNAIDTYVANTADLNVAFDTANALEGSPIEDGLGTYVNDLNEAENELTNEVEQAQPDTDTTDVGNGTASDEDGDDEEEINVEYENGHETGYSVGVLAALDGKPQNRELTDTEASADFRYGYQLGYLAGYASVVDGTATDDDGTNTDDDGTNTDDDGGTNTNDDDTGTGGGTNTDDDDTGTDGSTNTDDDDTGTDGTTGVDGEEDEPADPRFNWTAFAFRDQFEEITLPVESLGSLFDVKPEGEESFSTTTSTVAEPVTEATPEEPGTGTKTTNATTEVTLEQQVTSPTEWVVTQSWNRQLSSNEESTDDKGDNQDFDREGTEGLTISVINGTTTVVNYSVSDTFVFATGELEEVDDSAPAASWSVPEDWINRASYPEDNEEETENKEGDDKDLPPGEGGEEETDDSEDGNSQGARYVSTASFTITVTTTLLTLEDGRTGKTTTFSWSVFRSLTSLIAGSYSVSSSNGTLTSWSLDSDADADDSETDEGGSDNGPQDSTQPDPGTPEDSNSAPPARRVITAAPGGNGDSISASGEYFAYGSASISFGGNYTATVMDDGSEAPTQPSGSSTFGISTGSGAFASQTLDFQAQQTSGNSYSYESYNDTKTGGHGRHFGYTITATLGDSTETETETTEGDTTTTDTPVAMALTTDDKDTDAEDSDDCTCGGVTVSDTVTFGRNSHSDTTETYSQISGSLSESDDHRSRYNAWNTYSLTGDSSSGISYENETLTLSQNDFRSENAARGFDSHYYLNDPEIHAETTEVASHENSVSLTETDNFTITSGQDDVTVTSNASITAGYSDVFREYLEVNWSELDANGEPGEAKSNVQEAKGHFIYTISVNAGESEPTTTRTRESSYTESGDPIPDYVDISDPDVEIWLEDWDYAEAQLTSSDDTEEGGEDETTGGEDDTDNTGPGGVPDGGHVDPNTSHVYDADGNLVGKLSDDGNVYWPADWDENGPVDDGEDTDTETTTDGQTEDSENDSEGSWLDNVQLTLDGAGMAPGVGIVPDAANTAISLARGDWTGAGLNALAMVPILGQGTKGAQLVAKGAKAVDKARDAGRAASGLGAFGRAAPSFGSNFSKKVRKHIDQIRKRTAGQVDSIPSPGKGGIERVQQIIRERVAQGGGVRTTFGGENVVSFRDGGVSYIFRENGEFWTILKNP